MRFRSRGRNADVCIVLGGRDYLLGNKVDCFGFLGSGGEKQAAKGKLQKTRFGAGTAELEQWQEGRRWRRSSEGDQTGSRIGVVARSPLTSLPCCWHTRACVSGSGSQVRQGPPPALRAAQAVVLSWAHFILRVPRRALRALPFFPTPTRTKKTVLHPSSHSPNYIHTTVAAFPYRHKPQRSHYIPRQIACPAVLPAAISGLSPPGR